MALIEAEAPSMIMATVVCDCVTKSLVTFTCFEPTERCLAITAFADSDCSAEFSAPPAP